MDLRRRDTRASVQPDQCIEDEVLLLKRRGAVQLIELSAHLDGHDIDGVERVESLTPVCEQALLELISNLPMLLKHERRIVLEMSGQDRTDLRECPRKRLGESRVDPYALALILGRYQRIQICALRVRQKIVAIGGVSRLV